MSGPSLGTNLGVIADWSTNSPFVDVFKTSRHWITQRDGVWDSRQHGLLDLDANGWVRGFTKDGSPAPFDRVATVVNSAGGTLRDGLYVIDWDGKGTVQVAGDARVVSRSADRIVLDPGKGAVEIRILRTDPADTGDYIRNIRMFHSQDEALLDGGMIFNPAFLERIEDFRVLRFMDWMQTNNSTNNTWREAPSANEARYTTSGVPVSTMVALANETGADPWFNIPHDATAEYIRKFATYVRDNLDPKLAARFEYSNEVWNLSFKQATWAQKQAASRWGADADKGWMQWYGTKAAEMARIVADVFDDETGTRALNVFATHSAWRGLEQAALNAREHVADGGSAPRDAPFHVYAIAPYFGGSIGTAAMSKQVDQWIAQGEAGIRAALNWLARGTSQDSIASLAATIDYHGDVARGLGWQLEGYEGGQHVVDLAGMFGGGHNPARTAFFTALISRPEMEDLYTSYFETWRKNGGGLMAQYADFGRPGPYGSWGIWSSVTGPDTPRSEAVEEFRDKVAMWWADSRPGAVFKGIETWIDQSGVNSRAGTDGRDRLFGLGGNDSLAGRGGADSLFGNTGNDTLKGESGSDRLYGKSGDDKLLGGLGADRLDGGSGIDRLEGGAGNDTYVVTDTRDTVVELAGGGTDQVRASVSRTLAAQTEILLLTGRADLNGTGNALANRITGNTGDNHLSGLAGNDMLLGGSGRDRLDGGRGADKLRGGLGVDSLSGGSGNDAFIFRKASEGGDRISDFRSANGDNDRFELRASGFGGGLDAGADVTPSQFQVRSDGTAARDGQVRFIWESDDARLWFDSNGNRAGGLSLVADLQSWAKVTMEDLVLV